MQPAIKEAIFVCELRRETENKEGDIKNTNVKEQRNREKGKADD